MYQKILIPLDGSELAECSLQHAKAIALGCKAVDVIVIRVVEPLSAQGISALVEAGEDFLEKAKMRNQQDAKNYVLEVKSNLNVQGINCQAMTVEGSAAEEILNYTEKNNIDLIVMSTHGRSGLSRFLAGSVAEKVSRHSRVPVLLISPYGCRNFAV